MVSILSYPVKLVLLLLSVYRTIGPFWWAFGRMVFGLPMGCRMKPSCAAYTETAVRAHGIGGLLLGLKRLTRCHPYGARV